jgi:hypothetical protein
MKKVILTGSTTVAIATVGIGNMVQFVYDVTG